MYPLDETPSTWVLFAIGVLVPLAVLFIKPKQSLVGSSVLSAAIASFLHTAFEMIVRGFGPLFVIGLGLTFIFYLPISFAIQWLGRRVLPRPHQGNGSAR